MPSSEQSCLLDLLGVVVWQRCGKVLASRQTHHPLSSAGLTAACPFVQVTAICGRQLVVFIPCEMVAVSTNRIIQDENHNSLLISVWILLLNP